MIGSLKEIKEWLGIPARLGDEGLKVAAVSTDTRTIGPGSLFVALKGETFDGDDYVESALEKGAIAAITHKSGGNDPRLIQVPDTLLAYASLAKGYRRAKGFTVVGITGSSGKTTTKDMVASVLATAFRVVKTEKNNNNQVGLPLSILSAPEDTQILVLEMGMRALGEIAYLAETALPDIGIITNIGVAHMGELGSQENIFRAKGELLEALPETGTGIVSGEDGFAERLRERTKARIISCGFGGDAGVRGEILEEHSGTTRFRLHREGEAYEIHLPYIGRHLILDSLMALEGGALLGVPVLQGAEALAQRKTEPGRLHIVQGNRFTIIDDTYNANPQSMKASLDVLCTFPGRKAAILGDMRELGSQEVDYHREIGRYAFEAGVDAIAGIGKLGAEIAQGFLAAGGSRENVFLDPEGKLAGRDLYGILKDGDSILVKASRAMGLERIVRDLEGIGE